MKTVNNQILASKTSYKIGGLATYYYSPKTAKELINIVRWAKENSIPILTIGRGTNILISDSGWNGVVIDTCEMNIIEWNGFDVVCGAGILLHNLVLEIINRGFLGFEELAGIPGTIAGGVIMNAGAFGKEISENIKSVSALNIKTLELEIFKPESLDFGYRTSFLKNRNYIVTDVKFSFKSSGNTDSQKKVSEILKKRKSKQPVNLPNCGSVFKRPNGNYAGTLIEECGLKGYRVGGAMVSEKHANFIVNIDNATANDVRDVVCDVQEKVFLQKGIKLEPELIFIGKFKRELL